jgi:hypothetical protein
VTREADSILVTVVIPAYNTSTTIDASIRSARAQTHAALEIIVVDDGSTDDCAEIAKRHAAEDPRIQVLHKENGGVASARNHGMRASRGAYIAYLDSDDLWHPTTIEKQLATFLASDPRTTFVYALSYLIDAEDRVIGAVGHPFSGDVFLRLMLFNFVGNGSAIMVRRAAIDRIGGYDTSAVKARGEGGSEDALTQMRLARLGPVGVAPEYLVGYRRTPGTLSTKLPRMARAQHWCLDRAVAAAPETPQDVVTAAHAAVDIRIAVASLFRRDVAAAARLAASAIRRAPAAAGAMLASYLWRPFARRLRRGGATGVPFFEADPAAGGAIVDPLPAPGQMRRLAAADSAFAATRDDHPLVGLVPMGLPPAAEPQNADASTASN